MRESEGRIGRRFIIVALSLVAGLLSAAGEVHARTYPHIVAFGDSLSDHFGLYAHLEPIVGAYDPLDNPNGVLAVWSNGDVWLEYLADEWTATLENDAIAGAMTRGHEDQAVQALVDGGVLPPLGLAGQVDRYVDDAPAFEPRSTLFTIWIGANDLMAFGRGDTAFLNLNELIDAAMDTIAASVIALNGAGATDFLILNLPDIGRTPGFSGLPESMRALATQLVQSYNDALATTIADLEADLPNITIYTFDMFNYLDELLESGDFVDVTGTYMALDQEGNRTGAVNGDAEDYLFWDNIHPTTRAHRMVAESLNDTVFAPSGTGGDDTCFIRTAAGTAGPIPSGVRTAAGLVALFSVVGVFRRRFSGSAFQG